MRLRRVLIAALLATGALLLVDGGAAHARPMPISGTCPTCTPH